MSSIRSKNTRAEVMLRKALWNNGIRGYRLHYGISGRPDIAFVSRKIAIFVDGDFWHGYLWKELGKAPPEKYWQSKIEANISRDRRVDKELESNGWSVLRIWEHEIFVDIDSVVTKIRESVTNFAETS